MLLLAALATATLPNEDNVVRLSEAKGMNLNVRTCAVVYALNAKAVGIGAYGQPGTRFDAVGGHGVLMNMVTPVPLAVASVTEGSELVPELGSYYSAIATANGHGLLSAYASVVNNVQVLQCSQCLRYCAHKQAMVSHLTSHQRHTPTLDCDTTVAAAPDPTAPDAFADCFQPNYME
eukprot:jgi/Ulvmu1/4662/UM002_0393.1